MVPCCLSLGGVRHCVARGQMGVIRPLPGGTVRTLVGAPNMSATAKLQCALLVTVLCAVTLHVSRMLSVGVGSVALSANGPCIVIINGNQGTHATCFVGTILGALEACVIHRRNGVPGPRTCLFCSESKSVFEGSSSHKIGGRLGMCTRRTHGSYDKMPSGIRSRRFERSVTARLLRSNVGIFRVDGVLKRRDMRAAVSCLKIAISVARATVGGVRSAATRGMGPS